MRLHHVLVAQGWRFESILAFEALVDGAAWPLSLQRDDRIVTLVDVDLHYSKQRKPPVALVAHEVVHCSHVLLVGGVGVKVAGFQVAWR